MRHCGILGLRVSGGHIVGNHMPLLIYYPILLYQGWTQRGRLRGALQAEDLNRAVQAVSVRKPLLIGGGSGVASPGFFLNLCL